MGNYWRGITLPYAEPGVRLIRQSDIESFVHTLEGFRDELVQAEADLNAVYEEVKADARRRLGRLYNPSDYPPEVRDLFGVGWDFPSVEPPSYLMRIAPEVYEEERRRVAARFDEAVRLAEQAFASEFARLLSHLTARLANGEDGGRQVFRDSVVNNLVEFFGKFSELNVRSNPELDALVEQAQRLVRGVTPQALRDSDALRQEVTSSMARVRSQVEALITDAPRRRLVRARPSGNGGGHASCGLTRAAPSAASTPRRSTCRPSAPRPSAVPATSSRTSTAGGGPTSPPSAGRCSAPSRPVPRRSTPSAPGWTSTGCSAHPPGPRWDRVTRPGKALPCRAVLLPQPKEDRMTAPVPRPGGGGARPVLLPRRPTVWPAWPYLPVIRRKTDGAMDLGVLYDFAHTSGRTGYGCAVFLCNVVFVPDTEEELLAVPKEVFDTFEEVAAAGWAVD